MKVQVLAQSEHALQCAVVTWAAMHVNKWPALRLLFAVPNGASFGSEMKTLRSGRQVPVAAIRSRKMKAEGLRPGVPDLVLPVARHGFHGLFMELKTKTGRASPEQEEWIASLRAEGYMAVIVRGLDEALAVLRGYVAG